MLYDNIKDILKHTLGVPSIEMVKLYGLDGVTFVEGMSPKQGVVFRGALLKHIPELEGTAVGLTRLRVLQGYTNFPPFKENPDGVSIVTQERSEKHIPTEIFFKAVGGHTSRYRFMAEAIINNAVSVPKFNDVTWDIEVRPTKKAVDDLKYFASLLGSYENTFSLTFKNNNLYMNVGADAADKAVILFSEEVGGVIPDHFRWELNDVINILKLGENSECTMSLSSVGGLQISINSGLGVYTYIMPARV
jgi:hypothetical protein